MFKSIWTHNIEVIMTREIMSTQLIGLATHLNKIINRINGDDFNPSLIQEIKDSLHALDNNSASQDIDKKHFDKLILLCQDTCKRLIKVTEYMSSLNIRYTSKDCNINLLNQMLDEFTLSENNITVQMPSGSEIIQKEEKNKVD